jgi:hypothetical protein
VNKLALGIVARARGANLALSFTLLAGSACAQGTINYVVPGQAIYYAPVPLQHDLDLNGDGIIDYSLISDGADTVLSPLGNNRLITIPEPPPDLGSLVAALDGGFLIAPSLQPVFQWYDQQTDQFGHALIGADRDIGHIGYFSGRTAFVGLSFEYDGSQHYGWLRLANPLAITAGQLTDWAYETRPGTAIPAGAVPEPATWTLLTLGSGFIAWRAISRKYFPAK